MKNVSIKFSAPGKIHLLGEHSVVYGKPALLAAVNLRVTVHLRGAKAHLGGVSNLTKIIEPIVKKHCKIKTIPPYQLTITSQFPTGVGLGSSAAISAAYIAALLTYLKVKWNKALINELTFQAEKAFHGNPSGGDNSTVVFGGLVSYTKGHPIQSLSFSIPSQIAKNFILINTGTPKETTKEMVELVANRFKIYDSSKAKNNYIISRFKKILEAQEQLVKDLVSAIQTGNEQKLIQSIKAGQKNLEIMGVTSPYVKSIIRKIENNGGAAKICGGGGATKATGILLCYHPTPFIIKKIAKEENFPYFSTSLGVEGLRQE